MNNTNLDAAWQYHEETSHSPERMVGAGRLDWDNRPLLFKIYSTLEPVPLPKEFTNSPGSALDAIASQAALAGEYVPSLPLLGRLCFFANGITKTIRRAGKRVPFRAAATTGALYHIELYLVCGQLPDLAAGVYHYGAHDHSLHRLRDGDFRQALVEAAGEPSFAAAPVFVICTSTFWRNAWKYGARAYRHSFWDNGTILANLLAVSAAQEVPAKVILGFADEQVNRLIDVDPQREAAVSLVALGDTAQLPPPAAPVVPIDAPAEPRSRSAIVYPAIQAMHQASSLRSGDEAAAWRSQPFSSPAPAIEGPQIPIQPVNLSESPADPIEPVIRRRGSSRRFSRAPIRYTELSKMIDLAARPISADYPKEPNVPLSTLYLIANAVEGLQSGAYVFHPLTKTLELLEVGDFREEAGSLALGQDLAADAAANIYFLADLYPILSRFGNRGYRAAQLEAAILAGRLYLAAYALRLGATGLTFFDDEVTSFFSPHSRGKSVLFLIALGHPLRPGRK